MSSVLPVAPKTNDKDLRYDMENTQAYVSTNDELEDTFKVLKP